MNKDSQVPNISLDIAAGLVMATACYSLAEGILMQVSAMWLVDTRYLPRVLFYAPAPLIIIGLTLGLTTLWSRGKTAILSSIVGSALCLVVIQRFPGAYPWTGTSVNLYGTGSSYYWPLIFSIVFSIIATFLLKKKSASDTWTLIYTGFIYLGAQGFAALHQASRPLLEADYPFSRHVALGILGVVSLLAFPLCHVEDRIWGDIE